ncbi:MAG: hypothetical protein A2075_12430 [Geobacteraceae bacterium GWC2_58_44]|nr:MAG: hypothetical protein A2075_12430 [Geobacteraceae bacterium GWC2_58_44]HBG04730.1 hypothetical protein [Geobacter sp.]
MPALSAIGFSAIPVATSQRGLGCATLPTDKGGNSGDALDVSGDVSEQAGGYFEKGAPGGGPWTLAPRTDRLLLGSQFLELPEPAGYLLTPQRQPALVGLAPAEADRLPDLALPFVLRAGYAWRTRRRER